MYAEVIFVVMAYHPKNGVSCSDPLRGSPFGGGWSISQTTRCTRKNNRCVLWRTFFTIITTPPLCLLWGALLISVEPSPPQHTHTIKLSYQAGLLQLEAARHEALKDLERIELLADGGEELEARVAVALDGILLLGGVVEVEVRVVGAGFLVGILGLLEEGGGEVVDVLVGGRVGPLDGEEDVGEVAAGGVDAEGISRIGVAGGRESLGGDDLGEGLVRERDGQVGRRFEGGEGGVGDVEEAGHAGGVVLERGRHEELARAGRVFAQQLDREISQVGDAHGVEGLGQVGEVLEGGRVGLRLGVLEVGGDVPARGEAVGEAHDEGCVGVVGLGGGEGHKVVVLLLAGRDVLADEAAPEFALGEELHVETGDDAEIVGAALESLEEVGVGLRVGVDEFAGREDDLEVDHIVADETVAGREE